MATAAPGPNPLPRRALWLRVVLGLLGLLGVTIGTLAWVLASAPGASPDDDYHMASVWCPPPLESSGCVVVIVEDGTPHVEVPDAVVNASTCYRFQPNISAGCTTGLSPTHPVFTTRIDNGGYPGGYYRFHHVFASGNMQLSVVVMRIANVGLGLAGVVAAALLAAPTMRRNIAIAAVVAWVPMGSYLIASNNPSSWAISGVFTFAAAGFAAIHARGWRMWALLGVAAYGVLLACTARADAAVYCTVVGAAIWLLAPWRKKQLPLLGAAVLAAIAGALTFFSTGQSDVLTVSIDRPAMGPNQLLFNNIIELPDYLAGFYGLHFGPGWFDVRLYSTTTMIMIMLAGAVLTRCLGDMYLRKALAMSMVGGVMLGLPVYLMVNQGQMLVQNQPRYMLPLLAVFVLIGLTAKDGRLLALTRTQTALGVVLVSIAHSAALHAVIRRYVTGQDVVGFGLQHNTEWWWPWGPAPMDLWIIASIAFTLGLAALAYATYQRPHAKLPA